METFFKVKTPQEVFAIIDGFPPVGNETIPLEEALGRTLNRDLAAPEDLPHFSRSSMDGYAVRAQDTFGASESLPALVEVCTEVNMGRPPETHIRQGQAAKISTGGMLPEGADGVVMVEYCRPLDGRILEVSRSISPLENVILPGDDFKKGGIFLHKGTCLRPQELGVLAGFGLSEVPVFRRPRVAVISTGDEVVPARATPLPGQVRDVNRYTLSGLCTELQSEPLYLGLCPDESAALETLVLEGVRQADTVWVSGGSSVGTRDLTLQIFKALPDFELLVHGISISPGKPTIIGRSGTKPVVGLPGHVASALVVAEVFLSRLISRLSGRAEESAFAGGKVEALLSRNIESASGREDYIRVKLLQQSGDTLTAEPIFGKSGLISPLVEADGLLRVHMNTEGMYKGEKVEILLFKNSGRIGP